MLPSGERSEYIKPVVISDGFGICYDSIHTDEAIEDDIVIAKVVSPAALKGRLAVLPSAWV